MHTKPFTDNSLTQGHVWEVSTAGSAGRGKKRARWIKEQTTAEDIVSS